MRKLLLTNSCFVKFRFPMVQEKEGVYGLSYFRYSYERQLSGVWKRKPPSLYYVTAIALLKYILMRLR